MVLRKFVTSSTVIKNNAEIFTGIKTRICYKYFILEDSSVQTYVHGKVKKICRGAPRASAICI
jgi:hypothetical protein